MHVPVMAEEALSLLAIRPGGVYIDATAGMGGHTALIARQLTTGVVIANDRDAESLSFGVARQGVADHPGLHLWGGVDVTGMLESIAGWSPTTVIGSKDVSRHVVGQPVSMTIGIFSPFAR